MSKGRDAVYPPWRVSCSRLRKACAGRHRVFLPCGAPSEQGCEPLRHRKGQDARCFKSQKGREEPLCGNQAVFVGKKTFCCPQAGHTLTATPLWATERFFFGRQPARHKGGLPGPVMRLCESVRACFPDPPCRRHIPFGPHFSRHGERETREARRFRRGPFRALARLFAFRASARLPRLQGVSPSLRSGDRDEIE